MRPIHVGIDLGTTNSAAAVFDGQDLSVVRNAQGSVLTPSVVRVDARGNVLVGARARRFLDADPANTRSEFKRLMGTAHQLDFPASGQALRPEALSAEVLKSLRRDIGDQFGVLPERAVVSVPALFELHQIAATSEAARQAGFERIELIQEPVASAIAAGWSRADSNGPWLVYDLGGGTFDVSLLETQDGLLRVVGHDGDNFLGGRDFDRVLVDLVIARLAQEGQCALDRANPAHAVALRRLRAAVEEAKIELTRAREAPVFLAGLEVDGRSVDIDLLLTRAEHEALITPLVARSLEICTRLLAAHGLGPGDLERVVLVGGPTVTPLLREQVQATFDARVGEGFDPMTLVAQGAALFAGTVGLDGRPAAAASAAPRGPRVWLQFPTMTSDLSPFVVGKLLDPPAAGAGAPQVRVRRGDGGWQSEPTACDAQGTFALMLNLQARQTTRFDVFALQPDGREVALVPPHFSITHGLTLGEPPLSRSIGVALANDRRQVYFERGSPLPIRRSFTLHTVESVSPADSGPALRLPIVQGEFAWAHLCRLVGTLEIPASALREALPAGTEIELTLELDRAGQLRATARIVGLEQVFDQVALLVTPQLSVEAMAESLHKLRARAELLTRSAFQSHTSKNVVRLSTVLPRLQDVERSIAAARGGDLDAGEQVRRELSEFDAMLAEVEAERAWPELEAKLEEGYAVAVSWLAQYGSEPEKATLERAYQAARRAFLAQDAGEVERQLSVIRQLTAAAYYRDPGAWDNEFAHAASQVGEATDVRRAAELVQQGQFARRQRDPAALERIVRELWALQPVDRAEQQLGHGSSVRRR